VAQVIYGPVVKRKPPDAKYGQTEVGRLIAEARSRRGFSQSELARLLNAITGVKAVSRHEVARWERGARLPTQYWIGWLAAALNESWALLDRARCVDVDVRADVVAGRERVSARGAELITPLVVHRVRTAAEQWRSDRRIRQGHQLAPEHVDELRGVVAQTVVAGIAEHFGLAAGGEAGE